MTTDLIEYGNLSRLFDVSVNTYRFIISDGYRWDIMRQVFEKKKWYPEGSILGTRFVEHARKTEDQYSYRREIVLTYNFALNMMDKADDSIGFCQLYDDSRGDINWMEYAPGGASMIHPLSYWDRRYGINRRKIKSNLHKHLQNRDVLEVKIDCLEALIAFLLKCT